MNVNLSVRRNVSSLPPGILGVRPDSQTCLDMAHDLGDHLESISRMDEGKIASSVGGLMENLNTASPETLRDTLQGVLLHFVIQTAENRSLAKMA